MDNDIKPVLRKQANWEDLYFYQKSNVLYQMTFVFTKRFLTRGDRTVDQMVQAARSGKQNIVEGSADGVTSMEMELKLLNVARSGIKERMTAARLGYRTNQREEIARLTRKLEAANRRIAELEAKLAARG